MDSARHSRAAASVRATTTATLQPTAREAHVEPRGVDIRPDHRRIGGVALHAVHGGRVSELQVLARVLGGHTRHLAAVAHGDKVDERLADAAHDPLRTILDPREPVVATGLDRVADENPLLPHSPCDDAGVEFALLDSPLLDGVVDRIRLSIRARYQRHPLAARVPLEVRVDHPLTRRAVMIDPVDVTVFGQLARNQQRTLAITRIPEPQRERCVLGIAEPVYRVELDRSVRACRITEPIAPACPTGNA